MKGQKQGTGGAMDGIKSARALVEAKGGVKPDTTPRAAVQLRDRFVRPGKVKP